MFSYDYEDKMPWNDSSNLLGSIVYRLEQEWNGHYEDIKEAFEPFIEEIFENLKGDDSMCKCGNNEALPPHPCPYVEDMRGDSDTHCNCCEDCEQNCVADI